MLQTNTVYFQMLLVLKQSKIISLLNVVLAEWLYEMANVCIAYWVRVRTGSCISPYTVHE